MRINTLTYIYILKTTLFYLYLCFIQYVFTKVNLLQAVIVFEQMIFFIRIKLLFSLKEVLTFPQMKKTIVEHFNRKFIIFALHKNRLSV